MPMSGPAAQLGKDNTDGFNLALAAVNNTVAGRNIDVIIEDTQGKPDVAVTKAQKLSQSDKVNIIAGFNFTAECYALGPVIRDLQQPSVVSGNCSALHLLTDAKYKSPYLIRTSQTTITFDSAGHSAGKLGSKKAVILAQDGLNEAVDTFSRAFVSDGGQILQETYTTLGTNDYGPYVSQLDPQADTIALFETGIDGLRFGQALQSYGLVGKYKIFDNVGGMVNGQNRAQLKDAAVGAYGGGMYCECLDTPQNQAFLKVWNAKYPGRTLSTDVAQRYSGAQVILAALQKINGNVEDKQALLNALYATDVETIKGPIKLDQDHDVIENNYLSQVTKQADSYPLKLIETSQLLSKYDLPPDVLQKFPFGQMKGKWVGMTKDKLADYTK